MSDPRRHSLSLAPRDAQFSPQSPSLAFHQEPSIRPSPPTYLTVPGDGRLSSLSRVSNLQYHSFAKPFLKATLLIVSLCPFRIIASKPERIRFLPYSERPEVEMPYIPSDRQGQPDRYVVARYGYQVQSQPPYRRPGFGLTEPRPSHRHAISNPHSLAGLQTASPAAASFDPQYSHGLSTPTFRSEGSHDNRRPAGTVNDPSADDIRWPDELRRPSGALYSSQRRGSLTGVPSHK